MEGTVKGIFKILIKVPIIIFVCFFIFNIFSFSLSYFKLLGVSYAAMNTAMINNYIPANEKAQLEDYMTTQLQTQVFEDVRFTTSSDDPTINAFTRGQYGETVTVAVQGNYKWQWPLTPRQQTANDQEFNGLTGSAFAGFKTEAELEQARKDNSGAFTMRILYRVPGLAYYADTQLSGGNP